MIVSLLIINLLILTVVLWLAAGRDRQTGGRQQQVLLDTSAIIDGRIEEVALAGFMPATLLVPQFIIAELQHIADSSNELRRARGRFGLEMVRKLQAMNNIEIKIIKDAAPAQAKVDDKLVAIASRRGAGIVTTDFNLNKVATIHDVRVLNVNELAQALRPIVLPGERISLKLVQRGSEPHQGVGYLADGTMVVVDHGSKLIGREIKVAVNRIMQTVAGKMLFASVQRSRPESGSPQRRSR